jgi:hypothetical protein
MRNRRSYRRRGVSAVVTSLMLVAAVSMMGAALMVWSNSSFASQQREIADQTTSRINLIAESFVVEDVWFYTDGGYYANVTIRNTGDLAITISNIYINNTEAWDDGEIIMIDDVATIKVPKVIDSGVDWTSDRSQSIWVVTERGAEIKQVWKS